VGNKNKNMKTKKGDFWFVLRLLLLMNAALITVMLLAHPGIKSSMQKEEPCSAAKKINVDVLNSVAVKLM
jgi:hypothetical protein